MMNKNIFLIIIVSLVVGLNGSETQVSKRVKTTTEKVRPMDIGSLTYPNISPIYFTEKKDIDNFIDSSGYSPFGKIVIPDIILNITKCLKPLDIARLSRVSLGLNAIGQMAMTELNFSKKNSLDQINTTLARYAGPQLKKLTIDGIDLRALNWGLLKKCRNLEALSLSACSINKLPAEIAYLTKLKKLDLSENQLSATQNWDILPEFLQELDLFRCKLKLTALPARFATLYELKKLNLGLNDLFEVQNWDILPEPLEELYLDECKVVLEKLPDRIASLNRLKELSISGNNLSEVGNWGILPESLEELDIGGCSLIFVELPERIGSLARLKKLGLSYNNLSQVENWDILPESLEELELYVDQLVWEQLPPRIAFLDRLKTLSIYGNDLSQVQNWEIVDNLMRLETLIIHNAGVHQRPNIRQNIKVLFGGDAPAGANEENGEEENNDDE